MNIEEGENAFEKQGGISDERKISIRECLCRHKESTKIDYQIVQMNRRVGVALEESKRIHKEM